MLEQALASNGRACTEWLAAVDRAGAASGAGGQSTAVVAVLGEGRIAGASVGDSGAWLCTAMDIVDLTARQRRKPLVGSGSAVAVPFAAPLSAGRLLVASDGLFKYAPLERIAAAATMGDLDEALRTLIELVRLPSGGLQDDVSIALIAVPGK